MLHLHFAPSLDMLLPELLAGVRHVWNDPFAPPEVIVPGPAVGKWLVMHLAAGLREQPGCIANLKTKYIEHYLWDYLQPGEFRLLHQGRIQQVICALLDDTSLSGELFEPVRRYLSGPSGTDPLKRIQLAARVAHQFLEYEYNRPGVWRAGGAWAPPGIEGTWMRKKTYLKEHPDEPWQAELYRRMRDCFSNAAATATGGDEKWLTLPQLYRHWRATGGKHLPPEREQSIFIFGVTKISHFHRNLFVEISQTENIFMHVYLSNPCAEFWEDVNTRRDSIRRSWNHTTETAGITARAPDDYDKETLDAIAGTPLPDDHRLLELWGSAGKENIFLWCQDAQWDFDYRSPASIETDSTSPRTLLESLQISLLRREVGMRQPATGWNPDGSLRILACPDRGREIEEIREQLLDMVHNGTITMLNSAVVYLSDPAVYLPYIQRVFGRFRSDDPGYIPFCILGGTGKQTVYAQGITTFLDVLHSGFDRPRLFELLRNPIVQSSRDIPAEWVVLWEQWADRLGLFRGYHREHRKEMGDTGGTLTDIHTFRLGIARLLLGELARGPSLLDFRENSCDEQDTSPKPIPVLPFRDYSTSDRQRCEAFCATIEALYHDGRKVREAVAAGVKPALETLRELVHRWFGEIPATEVADATMEGTTARAFYDGLDALSMQQSIAGRTIIPPEEFFPLLLGCLPDEAPARTNAWTGGITFAPLNPGMIVPHDVVFAAGLDDVLFPGSNDRPSWDLLSEKRIIGDSDPVRDNRFAFLEILHAARKRLVLSYRARDMQKESELHPSSVLLELDAYLTQQGTGTPPLTLVQEIPWMVHESLEECSTAGRPHGSWNRAAVELAHLARINPKDRAAHRHDLRRSATTAPPGSENNTIPFRSLLRFFENPLDYHLSRTLGINLDDPPATSSTDEPRESGPLAISGLQDSVWKKLLALVFTENSSNALLDPEQLEQTAVAEIETLYDLHRAAGKAPEAMAGCMEREYLRFWASRCVKPLLQLMQWYPDHRFVENSDPSIGAGGTASLPVDCSDGRKRSVDCRYSSLLVPRGDRDNGSIAFIAFKSGGTSAVDTPSLWLAGTLQWIRCARNGTGRPIGLVLLKRGTKAADYPAIDRTVMVTGDPDNDLLPLIDPWLSAMVSAMVVDRACDFLPFAEVRKFRNAPPTVEAISDDLATDWAAYRPYESVFELTDARLPESDTRLTELVRARYSPMLDRKLIARETP